ncbi:MAG: hypothetical protein ACXWEA_00545 [Solirubrobacterales bacterium]
MGATNKRAKKATEAAQSFGSNPYVRRLIEDEELRDNIKSAFEAARSAYTRMSNGNGPGAALIDDNRVQRDLREAAESLRDASAQIRGKRRRRSRGGIGRWLLAGAVGAGLVLVFSEDARRLVLDRLFGAEEEFEYTSTTAPTQESVPTA